MIRDFLRAAVLGWITLRAAALSKAACATEIAFGVVPARTSDLTFDFTETLARVRLADFLKCLIPDLIRFATTVPPAAAHEARQSGAILA